MTLVDGNNWFRRRIETVLVGNSVKNCFYELHNKQGVVICVWDGFNALEKRRVLYPEYKLGRKKAGDNIYESQNLLKKLLKLSKVISLQVDGFEGDDVIAALAFKYKGKAKMYIESNDLDLYQLNLPMARDKFPEQAKWIKLMKTMVGDSSDNIPGATGFGKTSWEKFDDHQKQILEHIIVSGYALTEDQVRNMISSFFPVRALEWFVKKDNRNTLLTFYKVVGFENVPWPLIESSMYQGLNRPDLAEPVFNQYMM